MSEEEVQFINNIVKRGWLDLYHEKLIEIIFRQAELIKQLKEVQNDNEETTYQH